MQPQDTDGDYCYHCQMYWKVSKQQVDCEIDDYITVLWVLEEHEQKARDLLMDWQRSHFQSQECLYIFIT